MSTSVVRESGAQLSAAMAGERRAGVRLAIRVRFIALAVMAFWVATRAVGPAQLYYLAIVAGFALLGLGQILVSRRTGRPARVASGVLAMLDMSLLTLALVVPNPLAHPDWPVAMQLRLGNFDFFYLFIAFAVLGYSPGLALWAGIAAVVAWGLGVLWVLAQPDSFTLVGSTLLESGDLGQLKAVLLDPDYVSLEIWVQQSLIAVLVAAILALAVWRARRLAFQQVRLARERANLSRYFSPLRAEELARSAAAVGSVREQPVAVLFVDIVGFTRMCEALQPTEVIDLLREFHRRMATAVFDHGGTLEKYIGDAVMATFGTPEAAYDDAARAVACARAMLAAIAEWNVERHAAGELPIQIAIGTHHGNVVLGDVGDDRCMEFAVLGDTVNVASHLESLCRSLGSDLAVSDALIARARQAGDVDIVEGLVAIEPQRLKDRSDLVRVWIREPHAST
jgi:adenylate cyclase